MCDKKKRINRVGAHYQKTIRDINVLFAWRLGQCKPGFSFSKEKYLEIFQTQLRTTILNIQFSSIKI